jgi:hypothetical protein
VTLFRRPFHQWICPFDALSISQGKPSDQNAAKTQGGPRKEARRMGCPEQASNGPALSERQRVEWAALISNGLSSMPFPSPFDLRQQVGKLVVTKLAVFPTDLEAEAVLDNHFALHSIRDPDDYFMEQEGLGFLSVHIS